MNRGRLPQAAAWAEGSVQGRPASRVRPSDPGWPSEANWDRLKREVGGRLITPQSPLSACRDAPSSVLASAVLQRLRNPYSIGEQPGLTQTSGWVGAWTSQPSAYAVVARTTEDLVAAVTFARENNLRLVVKGGGHSYQGTSNAADSLLVWTREMHAVTVHAALVASGCAHVHAPQPAGTIAAGAQWRAAYQAVTTRAGRDVQGGGCATVGVAGLIRSGGFGSFSKNDGLAAAALLEAEIVTADGAVLIANACTNADLFWGIKGGGSGSLGIVTRRTLRTRELPLFGSASSTDTAASGSGPAGLALREHLAMRVEGPYAVAFTATRGVEAHVLDLARVHGARLDLVDHSRTPSLT